MRADGPTLVSRYAVFCCTLAGVLYCVPAYAYIGPGAGMAFLGSFLVLFATFILAFISLLTWPIRWVFRSFRGNKAYRDAVVDRVVVLGLDGLDPELSERFMCAGLMPHFERLREDGTFMRLGTTYPAVSPVAWSSFQTGCNPGKHGIFDFLTPDRRTYMARLSSTDIHSSSRRITLGKFAIPLGRPTIRLLRRSRPFWSVLGDHGIFSTVLRVPITFPPEKFNGVMLSAMCVPDLRGTQGSFSFYTTRRDLVGEHTGGEVIAVENTNGTVRGELVGPENFMRRDPQPMRVPFTVKLYPDKQRATLKVDGQKIDLQRGEYSPWVKVRFRAGPTATVRGVCRFLVKEVSPEFSLYVTPINIDPEKPALPISHPLVYSIYLAKMHGEYATLGLAEDTWALNERVIDESDFLEQTYSIHDERERMFFDALDRTRRGLCVCVFDATDRIQHMFTRYLDPEHPANRDKDTEVHRDAIKKLYCKADELVGRVMERLDERPVLFVVSDHGFGQFARGINMNSWLLANGYLALKDGATSSGEWFEAVDWDRTRAYALGMAGIFVNLRGREFRGTVSPGEQRSRLVAEIIEKLRGLTDPERGCHAIKDAFDSHDVYHGPYVNDAPDVVVGYRRGYRASWDGVTGKVDDTVFEDNVKSWSGDHSVDPREVPGVLFCNKRLSFGKPPNIADVGPTVLRLFGVDVPRYMDGVPFDVAEAAVSANDVPTDDSESAEHVEVAQ